MSRGWSFIYPGVGWLSVGTGKMVAVGRQIYQIVSFDWPSGDVILMQLL